MRKIEEAKHTLTVEDSNLPTGSFGWEIGKKC